MTDEQPQPATHLYQIVHPNDALIASQLMPRDFAGHYQPRSGAGRRGKLIFAEIDPDFRHPYFGIDDALANLKPHPDGTPKRTKFISCYRALEHIDLKRIRNLYLSNADGNVLGLAPSERVEGPAETEWKVFSELCPVSMLALTKMPLPSYAKMVTDPRFGKGAPKILLTALDLDVAALLKEFERNPLMPGPISCLHPSKLRDAVAELTTSTKPMKGLCLCSGIDDISFKFVHTGFWFITADESLFFPMPSIQDIERENYRFWRSL